MSHPLRTTVDDFVEGLKGFERDYITQERVRDFMDAHHLSAAELLDEFERNRAATIRAVETADPELFGRSVRSAGGFTGPLAAVLHAVAVEHVLEHIRDLAGSSAIGR